MDYTVKQGDTMAAIAKQQHVPLSRLIADNEDEVPDPAHLKPGDQLEVADMSVPLGMGKKPLAAYHELNEDQVGYLAEHTEWKHQPVAKEVDGHLADARRTVSDGGFTDDLQAALGKSTSRDDFEAVAGALELDPACKPLAKLVRTIGAAESSQVRQDLRDALLIADRHRPVPLAVATMYAEGRFDKLAIHQVAAHLRAEGMPVSSKELLDQRIAANSFNRPPRLAPPPGRHEGFHLPLR
ncbi:MAG: hypothetical protein JWM80_4616 [Cyanobacteria bacterium RYN_339]|nr:hypothetical protein [Cyanobacteria bacterium RYN_339]